MTGQILGGTSVTQAARYQILIVYFIATCSFGTILMELHLALRVCFDSRCMLRENLLQKRDKKRRNFLATISSSFGAFLRICDPKRNTSRRRSLSFGHCNSNESTYLSPSNGTLSVATPNRDEGEKKGKIAVIGVERLCYGFEVNKGGDEEAKTKANVRERESETTAIRILFENLSFQLHSGDTALITGPSGVGKSTLLRIIAGLTGTDAAGIIKRCGNTQAGYATSTSMPGWRKKVRYVPQTKVEIPGTPNDFLRKISSFSTWNNNQDRTTISSSSSNNSGSSDYDCDHSPSYSEMKSKTRELTKRWGMNDEIDLLNSEWKVLSGGESQRMLIAISLASLSKNCVLLLDESTSALDQERKIQVENTVQEFCKRLGSVSIWISHDPGQKDRMGLTDRK